MAERSSEPCPYERLVGLAEEIERVEAFALAFALFAVTDAKLPPRKDQLKRNQDDDRANSGIDNRVTPANPGDAAGNEGVHDKAADKSANHAEDHIQKAAVLMGA